MIRGRRFQAHRLAWLYVYGEWPNGAIDHINRDPGDNRISNLRLATPTQNNANRARPACNTSGVKGVSWIGKSRKWQAQITVHGRQKYLGRFSEKDLAVQAYRKAASAYFGEFARA
jgi:hypothetical protein